MLTCMQCSRNSSKGIEQNHLTNLGPCYTSSSYSKQDWLVNIKKSNCKMSMLETVYNEPFIDIVQYQWENLCFAICWIDHAYKSYSIDINNAACCCNCVCRPELFKTNTFCAVWRKFCVFLGSSYAGHTTYCHHTNTSTSFQH